MDRHVGPLSQRHAHNLSPVAVREDDPAGVNHIAALRFLAVLRSKQGDHRISERA